LKSLADRPDLILLDLELGKEWGLDIIGDKTLRNGKLPPRLFIPYKTVMQHSGLIFLKNNVYNKF